MANNWNKAYSRINWANSPDTTTPLGANNLNRTDVAINTLDDRVIMLDTSKLDIATANGLIKNFEIDNLTGIITITHFDNSIETIDTVLEKVAVNFDFDENTQELVVILSDGTTKRVDLSAFIVPIEFVDSDTIAFSNANNTVSASVKANSITDEMIEANYLANIKVESASASTSAQQASEFANNADFDSKLSQSYAIGSSGVREGEDTDNAKYYKEQSALFATNASNSATTATEQAELSQSSATNAAASESNASTHATNASASADSASQYATNASNSADSANASAVNANSSVELARTYANNASASATNANTSATNASNYATQSQSYAVGSTNSSKYYYEQTKQISESFSGALRPMGTVAFANLPSLANATEGDMYNVSDEFVTTTDFNEGEGITIPAGSNVYKTTEGKWDILAGSPVTGVKGANETSFRRGNVNITAENIAALRTDGDSADNIVTFTSNDNLEPTEITDIPIITSGEKHSSLFSKISTIFKNVRYLIKELGTTDISEIGDGTVKGGLSTLNSNMSDIQNNTQTYSSESTNSFDITLPSNGIFIITIMESLSTTTRNNPSYGVIYNNNGLWSNIQKSTDCSFNSLSYTDGVATLTFTKKVYVTVKLFKLT